jgi:ribonuclease I
MSYLRGVKLKTIFFCRSKQPKIRKIRQINVKRIQKGQSKTQKWTIHRNWKHNGKSRDTGYTRHRTKTNKAQHRKLKTKKISNTEPTEKPVVNPGVLEGKLRNLW